MHLVLSPTRPSLRHPTARRAARPTRSVIFSALGKQGPGHIHDPVGIGQQGGAVKPLQEAQEQQRHMQAAALEAEQQKQAARPGSASLDRFEAANKEIQQVEQEKAGMREESQSDDEWAHMSRPKKWCVGQQGRGAALYSWLRTGVEPL
ncbi:hypothetical protein ABPG77_010600 [Micractinium sp. CCAP 211/92]